MRYLVSLLVLLSLSACAASRPDSTQNRDVAEGFGQFMHRAWQTARATQAHHTANSEWPESFEVLQTFAEEHEYEIQPFVSEDSPRIDAHVINLREDAMDIGLELELFGRHFSGIATIYAEGNSEDRLAYIELDYAIPNSGTPNEVAVTLTLMLSNEKPSFDKPFGIIIAPSAQQ